ncbi:MAG TPA: alanine racemase [Verrucomicrobiae bacterium]|nr:alanine racemase [Verrucomicrobiae bacterium]
MSDATDAIVQQAPATSIAFAPQDPQTATTPLPAQSLAPSPAARPAWIEIDLSQLRRNFQAINRHKAAEVRVLGVVKDEAYGHGALPVARIAMECGVDFFGLSTLDEAIMLRQHGIQARLLLLGDRHEAEHPDCIRHSLTCCLSEPRAVEHLGRLAANAGRRVPVHMKINTGMNRYGVCWEQAASLAALICSMPALRLEGVLSHFAQSDETDKSFAKLQLARFNLVLEEMAQRGIPVELRHLSNSGGFLDLPQAHFDMVRVGILPLGVYPSSVCRRLPGIEPAMTVKARIAAIQELQPGDTVGYGMRYAATSPRRIAVLPLGYGDGFPRVRNQGCALVHGQRVPIVGGVAMDALTVDITEAPEAQLWDEAVLMGRQGQEEISVHELAKLKNSVSYDVLAGWRARLPRIFLNQTPPA